MALFLSGGVYGGGFEAVNLTRTMLDMAEGPMDQLTKIGIGIGSVLLLVVIFMYVSQILDGGKFQVKMLVPLLIYLCVCNFKYVASPVVSFVVALQDGCYNAVKDSRESDLRSIARTSEYGREPNGVFDAFILRVSGNMSPVERSLGDGAGENDDEPQLSEDQVTESTFTDSNGGSWLSRTVTKVTNFGATLKKFWEDRLKGFLMSFVSDPTSVITYGFFGLVASVVDAIASILEMVVAAMGAVMIAIVVAFGPITWAFAVWPGNTKTIGAWAIRMCQFSLYSPLCLLITSFVLKLIAALCEPTYSILAGGNTLGSLEDAGGAITVIIAFLLAEIACLVAIPAIASMVIEGAQGYVSLVQGLQTVTSIYSDTMNSMESLRDHAQMTQSADQSATLGDKLDRIGRALGADMN